jgi:hypothetical protein
MAQWVLRTPIGPMASLLRRLTVNILFDSRKTSKPARFGRGLFRFIPFTTKFEPSDEDRAWSAREFADSACTRADLRQIENHGAKTSQRLEECRPAFKRCEAILADQSMPPVSPVAEFHPSAADWTDYEKWCARLAEMNEGIELEPRSTPISDQDIENVNVAG